MLRRIVKNAFRHELRTTLTLLGMVIAIAAFVVLQTPVSALYEGVNLASSTSLITRNAIANDHNNAD